MYMRLKRLASAISEFSHAAVIGWHLRHALVPLSAQKTRLAGMGNVELTGGQDPVELIAA